MVLSQDHTPIILAWGIASLLTNYSIFGCCFQVLTNPGSWQWQGYCQPIFRSWSIASLLTNYSIFGCCFQVLTNPGSWQWQGYCQPIFRSWSIASLLTNYSIFGCCFQVLTNPGSWQWQYFSSSSLSQSGTPLQNWCSSIHRFSDSEHFLLPIPHKGVSGEGKWG